MTVRLRAWLCVAALWSVSAPVVNAQTPPPQPPAGTPSGSTQTTPPVVPVAPPVAAPVTAPVTAVVPPPAAPATLPAEVLDPILRLSQSIETAEKSIQQLKELESDLQRLRGNVEQIIYDSTSSAESLRPQLAEVKSQIEKLGPTPGKDQPPESPTVISERLRLNQLAGALDGAVKTAELAWVRAKQLIDRITVMRYQIFTRNLLERRSSPVLPSTWREVIDRVPTIVGRTQYYGRDWSQWASRKSNPLVGLLLAIAAGGGLLWWLLSRFVTTHRARFIEMPTFFDRISAASWVAPARMAIGLAVAVLAYNVFDNLELLFSPWERPAEALLKGALVYAAGSAMARTVLSPHAARWRIVPIADGTAFKLVRYIRAFIAVYVLDTVLNEFGRAIYVPLVVTVVQSFLTNLVFAGLLIAMLLTPFHPQTGPERAVNGRDHSGDVQDSRLKPYWLKLPLWLLAVAIIVSSALGYVALGRFMAQQLVLSGTVLAVLGLFYLAIRALTRGRHTERSRIGALMENRFGLDAQRQGQIAKLIELAATFTLFLIALPILLLQWGFAGADIRDWAKALFFGFEIGQFRISLVRILIGVVMFTALLFLTRVIQRWLRERVLAQSRMDGGVANSIDTAVGYGGVMLAALVSVSYAGFDITSLAIVAGALSVGIGFGLQSIVNNFVSGLILLVERPIKVGDWIVVGDQQGNVRRISVRSTEIETFEKASLIVPNSELIAGRVLNWTHRNMLGRLVVKVSVDPTADPQKMIDILKAAAHSQALLLRTPEPSALLDYFGSDRLEFSLRATLSDVNMGGRVQSDLRLAILKGCREAGLIASMITQATASAPPAAVAGAPALPAAPVIPSILTPRTA